MKTAVFQIEHTFDHVVDGSQDAELLSFPNSNFLGANVMTTRLFELPAQLFGRGNLESLGQSDFPLVKGLDCVFSKRVWNILNEVKSFSARFIPLTIIDEQFLGEPLHENGALKPDLVKTTGFGVIQMLIHPEVLDHQASEIIMDKDYPDEICFIKRFVLKEPKDGFPPLFRIPEKRNYLFVSAEAKTALEEAGIQRCTFKPIETSS